MSFSFLREIESFISCCLHITDKVFGLECSTQKVYEEGAKDVALSALTGMNGKYSYCKCSQQLEALNMFPLWYWSFWMILSTSQFLAATIFAYGQTSSGKTFTMRGITENAVKDVYEHIRNVSLIHIKIPYSSSRSHSYCERELWSLKNISENKMRTRLIISSS